MTSVPQAAEVPAGARVRALADYAALTKPRLVAMVLATTAVGFFLASGASPDYAVLGLTLVGTGLAAGGTLALNQYLERDLDARMLRTRDRPLPAGRLRPMDALVFGVAATALGIVILAGGVGAVAALVTAFTAATYLFAYTPLKRVTPLCVLVGAVPGALPPVTGWTAGGGALDVHAGVLFAILFLWQVPHSLAIARVYAEDYARAGFRLLPRGGRERWMGRHVVAHSAALLAVALLPTLVGLTGPVYFATAVLLGIGLFACAVSLAAAPTLAAARRVMFASLVYLPLLFLCMVIDKAGV